VPSNALALTISPHFLAQVERVNKWGDFRFGTGMLPGRSIRMPAIQGNDGHVCSWHETDMERCPLGVRFRGQSGSRTSGPSGQLLTDTVEKVENRTTPRISQMLIFGQLRRWDAP
jgi:hypothetical protein